MRNENAIYSCRRCINSRNTKKVAAHIHNTVYMYSLTFPTLVSAESKKKARDDSSLLFEYFLERQCVVFHPQTQYNSGGAHRAKTKGVCAKREKRRGSLSCALFFAAASPIYRHIYAIYTLTAAIRK